MTVEFHEHGEGMERWPRSALRTRQLGLPKPVDSPEGKDDGAPARHAFDEVVLGIDFAPASLAAASWATTHLAPSAHATLVHVLPFPTATDALPAERTAAERSLRQLVPALRGGLSGLAAMLRLADPRLLVRLGRPSTWLTELAESDRRQLVTLGRRRNSARERVGEPNIIERVARLTTNPLLVVPEGFTERPRHVIAALDIGESAVHVLRSARSLAERLSARLTVAHVQSPAHGTYERVVRTRRSGAKSQLRSAADPRGTGTRAAIYRWLSELLDDAGGSAFAGRAVLTGDAGREIMELAGRLGAPLIVAGRRGADAAPHGSIGSVVRELLTRAEWPVLAVEPRLAHWPNGHADPADHSSVHDADNFTQGVDGRPR
jgi:nucleotide-binding universal stress UspA family protein